MASLSAVAGNAVDVRRNTFTSGGVRVPRRAGFARVARVPRVRAVVNAASGPEVRGNPCARHSILSLVGATHDPETGMTDARNAAFFFFVTTTYTLQGCL